MSREKRKSRGTESPREEKKEKKRSGCSGCLGCLSFLFLISFVICLLGIPFNAAIQPQQVTTSVSVPAAVDTTFSMAELRYVDAISAGDLDQLLPQSIKDSGFTGQDLVDIGRKWNVNPGVLWSFAWVDSYWGESRVGATGNVMGISTDKGPLTDLSIHESVSIAGSKANGWFSKVSSFEEFAAIWAPVGAANDYNSTNWEWPALVTQAYWEKIGPYRREPTVTLANLAPAPFLDQNDVNWALGVKGESIYHLPRGQGQVALTFDVEGGAEKTLPGILDLLDREEVKATFFILGSWGEKHPELLREIYLRGHLLANHGWDHPRFAFLDRFRRTVDVEKGEELIFEATGRDPQPWFRLPFGSGSTNQSVLSDLESKGYRSVFWSIDTEDWKGLSAPVIVAEAAAAEDGDIVLFHPQAKHTAEALPEVISQLKTKGLRFARLDLAEVTVGTAATLPAEWTDQKVLQQVGDVAFKETPMVKVSWFLGDVIGILSDISRVLEKYQEIVAKVPIDLPVLAGDKVKTVENICRFLAEFLRFFNKTVAQFAWVGQPNELKPNLRPEFFERRPGTAVAVPVAEIVGQTGVTAQPVQPWEVGQGFKAPIGYSQNWPELGGVEFLHAGVDVSGSLGEPIYAWKEGKVAYVGPLWLQGNGVGRGDQVVVLDHGGGEYSTYSHNQETLVKVGEVVEAGREIAEMGSEGYSLGPHLHFEVRENTTFTGDWQNPWSGGAYVDPEPLIPEEPVIPVPTPTPTPEPIPMVVGELRGFQSPLSSFDPESILDLDPYVLPGADRDYRCGVHWGTDVGGYFGESVMAAKTGVVVRSDVSYIEPTAEERQARLSEACRVSEQYGPNSQQYWVAADVALGRQVWIQHEDGSVTVYGHLSAVSVESGQRIEQGQKVGEVGNSGTEVEHLHFEIRLNNGQNYYGQEVAESGDLEELRRLYVAAFEEQ